MWLSLMVRIIVIASDYFDTNDKTSESDRFVSFIQHQENGNVIAIAVKDDASKHLTGQAKQVIASLGSTKILFLDHHNSWSMISAKGYQGQVVETLSTNSPANTTMCLPCGGILPLADNNQVLLKALSFGNKSGMESSVIKTDQGGSRYLGGGTAPGLKVISIDPESSQVMNSWSFPTGTSDSVSQQLVQAIESIPTGTVVAIAGCGDITAYLSDQAKLALESVGVVRFEGSRKMILGPSLA